MPNAQDLYQAHIDAGLNVLLSRSDWATNGGSWAVGGKPEGIIEHHTAPPPYSSPYPLNKLDGRSDGRIKCNINTKQDGSVYLMAYESCNYSAGSGAGKILTDYVRKSIAPTANGMFPDTQGGNSHFWNYENDHPGDGSPIAQEQFDAIIISTDLVIAHFGLDPEQVIGHAEWSRRKIDPKWSPGGSRAIVNIRTALGAAMPSPPPVQPPQPPPTTGDEYAMWPIYKTDGYDSPSGSGRTWKNDDVKSIQVQMNDLGSTLVVDGKAGQGTLDAFFAYVGARIGGSYIDGTEGGQFQKVYAEEFGGSGGDHPDSDHNYDAKYAKKSHPHTAATTVS